jgi:hypothetical protein
MNTLESFEALRRANPRTKPGIDRAVEAAAAAVRAGIATGTEVRVRRSRGHEIVRASALGGSLAAAAAVAALLLVGLPRGGTAVEDAAAAVNKAAAVTAASAQRSGTVVVRITHDGELWSGSTIRWNGEDLASSNDMPDREGRVGTAFLLVDGMMYGLDAEDGGWVELGPPESIDPDSGTTPAEVLAAVREDVGGATLRRISAGMTGLTTSELEDGSILYRGRVAAGEIAREAAFKEGESIRVLPFGNVAHGEASDPANALDTSITVGPDGIIRELRVTWEAWTYTVAYSDLGATPAPQPPKNARPLRR